MAVIFLCWQAPFDTVTTLFSYQCYQLCFLTEIRISQPSPSRSEASARKKRGCSTRLGPRCDVTAKGASERLADFSIFNMAENLYIQITLYN
jgi:hypothetical protein